MRHLIVLPTKKYKYNGLINSLHSILKICIYCDIYLAWNNIILNVDQYFILGF